MKHWKRKFWDHMITLWPSLLWGVVIGQLFPPYTLQGLMGGLIGAGLAAMVIVGMVLLSSWLKYKD